MEGKKANIENVTVNILLTIYGELHLVAMEQDRLDAITMLIKSATHAIVPTGINQAGFNDFLKLH